MIAARTPRPCSPATRLFSCSCLHAGMHHQPECVILNCGCQEFERSVIRGNPDSAWLRHGKPTRHRRPASGKGSSE